VPSFFPQAAWILRTSRSSNLLKVIMSLSSNSLFQLQLLHWAFQLVNISVAGFDYAFLLNFATIAHYFFKLNLCSLMFMQRTRCYRWRSNQALYPYYLGFWSWIFWACHKGKFVWTYYLTNLDSFFLFLVHKFFNPFHNADVSSRENVPSFPWDESWWLFIREGT
jgi:hypothetical protein